MRLFSLFVAMLLLAGCATAPATQNAKESAGTSDVAQWATTIQNDLRHVLPDTVKVEGDFNVTFNFHGDGGRSSDVSQTNSGSTTATQAATATQTPTSSTSTTPSVTVTPTGN